MKPLNFTKMHGLGNDFIVLNNLQNDIDLSASQIRQLSDRHFGIGFDQLLIVEPASVADAEFDYRIYNADGGEVEHCGNGARCFARFVRDQGLSNNAVITVNTMGGVIRLRVLEDGQVTVDMGVPVFEPARIPLVADTEADEYSVMLTSESTATAPGLVKATAALNSPVVFGSVAIGNPHAVIVVDDVDTAPVETLGPILESHSLFPQRVNVGFMQIVSRSHVRLRVYERGVGETRACGTGACAAVVVGNKQNLLDKNVVVSLPGGDLDILWPGANENVEMTGPCTTVFEGQTRM